MSEVRSVDLQELGVTKETFIKIYSMGEDDGREDAIDDRANLLAYICKKYNIPLLDMNCTVDEWEKIRG